MRGTSFQRKRLTKQHVRQSRDMLGLRHAGKSPACGFSKRERTPCENYFVGPRRIPRERSTRTSWRRPPVEIPRWSGLSSRDYPPAASTTTRKGLLPSIGSVGGISSAVTRAFLQPRLLLRHSSPYAYVYVYYKYINIHTIARRTAHTCQRLCVCVCVCVHICVHGVFRKFQD